MSESVHAREKRAEEERCAFCHDAFVSGSVDPGTLRADCSKCGALHHAGCFVENAGCAVMGCGGAETTRVGDLEERMNVALLAREIGATVDRPIPARVVLGELRRVQLALVVIGAFLAFTIAFGFLPQGPAQILVMTVPMLFMAVMVYATIRWRGVAVGKPVEPDERTGDPCPKCGTPLELSGEEGERSFFCYRCEGGVSAPP